MNFIKIYFEHVITKKKTKIVQYYIDIFENVTSTCIEFIIN
jgi:hypothetical protein